MQHEPSLSHPDHEPASDNRERSQNIPFSKNMSTIGNGWSNWKSQHYMRSSKWTLSLNISQQCENKFSTTARPIHVNKTALPTKTWSCRNIDQKTV